MHRTLKTLLLWLLILALPMQGFAVSIRCATAHHAMLSTVQSVDHHHHGGVANAGHHHHEAVGNTQLDESAADYSVAAARSSASKYAGTSCSSCAACCLGAAALPSDLKWPSRHNSSELVIDSSSPLVTGYIPPSLERPPKRISA